MAVGTRFIDRSRKFLKTNYLPKIEAAVRPLSPADVWWRPNEALLHEDPAGGADFS